MKRIIITTAVIAALLCAFAPGAGAFTPGSGASGTGRSAVLVGAHSIGGFTSADQALGPLNGARFYFTTLPGSFAGTSAAKLPSGVVPVISYNTLNTNVASYVKSVTRPIWLNFHHEPEDGGAYQSGAAYVTQFDSQTALIRSAGNPNVRIVTVNAGYAYRSGGGNGLNGSYLPPASETDGYALDLYQICCAGERWPAHGLADYDRFQNWLKLVAGRGKPLMLTEYGILASNSVRDSRIQQDAAYLSQQFGGNFGAWLYFWVGEWKFTDPATVSTWHAIASQS